jgi:hypothetical protein
MRRAMRVTHVISIGLRVRDDLDDFDLLDRWHGRWVSHSGDDVPSLFRVPLDEIEADTGMR